MVRWRVVAVLALVGSLGGARAQVSPVGTGSFVTNQATALTSPIAPLVPGRQARASVTIENMGTTDIYLGGPNVTTVTGFLLMGTRGASVTWPVQAPIYGVTVTGSGAVAYVERY